METTRRDFLKTSVAFGATFLLAPASIPAISARPKNWLPAYAKLDQEGGLAERIRQAQAILERCELCPRQCGVDRSQGEQGFCRAPAKLKVYSAHPHFGEELSLVGWGGSGTIFFSNCNLRCVFCQNWPIAHRGKGEELSDEELAGKMLRMQEIGCHNVNLVTPTHVMPHILAATRIAYQRGLRLPLVYNTSGYERVEVIRLLDGIVDIYLPDLKYMNARKAALYSSDAADYPEHAKAAIIEMNRQVGQHTMDERGVALRGLMIRHLVMPNRVAGTRKFTRWVASELSAITYVNIMPQYQVDYLASDYPEIARAITKGEFLEAMRWAEEAGLTNLDPQCLAFRDRLL